jgi:GNAT superfamily N-acetyltransferase
MAFKTEQTQLPDSYSYAYKDSITPLEVIALRAASDWGREHDVKVWQDAIQQSIETVGVRDIHKVLVGVGFLVGNARHAILCDFTVHPEHRNRGLGKAILRQRLIIADNEDIPYLYTDISQTNTLRDRYLEMGFVAAGNVLERKSR